MSLILIGTAHVDPLASIILLIAHVDNIERIVRDIVSKVASAVMTTIQDSIIEVCT